VTLELLAIPVLQARKVPQDLKVQKASLVLQGQLGRKAILDQPDLKDRKVSPDPPALLVVQDLPAPLAPPVLLYMSTTQKPKP